MVDNDPFETQRDIGSDLLAELSLAGFDAAELVGRGGFAEVYRCFQASLDRTVAVKVLTEALDDDNRARFLREQRAMGRLTGHPNIVGVLQVGQTESGRPYLVMQYHERGSLDARIREDGPLTVEEAVRVGRKLAGALGAAHRVGIVHRDVKPANILFTDYDEPVLTDFGIAHFAGGFQTAAGMVTGSPAFTAPEVLGGDPPTSAADVYGLGSTLFCALTGHAAFERVSGEQVVAQFLRITTQHIPDLRESGFSDDICAIIEAAMSRDPRERPTAAAFGIQLRRLQHSRNRQVEESAPAVGRKSKRHAVAALAEGSAEDKVIGSPPSRGNLPLEMTSFVGRRADLSEVRNALSAARLVTLTGVGGVGKTRLALRAAATMKRSFTDGVWLVEFGELRDPALVADLVAATLEVRDQSARPLHMALNEFLGPRTILLVIDNCEQVIAGVAELTRVLLPRCPNLRVLATSREPIGIDGELLFRVVPLATPEPDRTPSLRAVSRFDAVTLFTQRAAVALPGFELTADSSRVVSEICARLDGLPLAIELAAARLRTLSPEQILQRLTDRYALLSRGSRSAPNRQRTLRWSIDWSYDLCTPAEQQLWDRLSVFAGSFELDAAEGVCGEDFGGVQEGILDTISSLVDKSILFREESHGAVRFRMLDTVREYGRSNLQSTTLYTKLRQQHRDWYLQLTLDSARDWISPRQPLWVARLEQELPNLRESLEFSLSRRDGIGLVIAAALLQFWISRGLFCEGRRWLDRALTQSRSQSITDQAKALHAAIQLALLQGDIAAATPRVEEARALDPQRSDPIAYTHVAAAEGFAAFVSGDLDVARTRLEQAVELFDEGVGLTLQIDVLGLLGWTYQSNGRNDIALTYHEQVLTITESHSESIYRSYALWSMGVTVWRHGNRDRAVRLLQEALRLTRLAGPPIMTAACLQALAWVTIEHDEHRRAVIMAGASDSVSDTLSRPPVFPNLVAYAEQFERSARKVLGDRSFEAAYRQGRSMNPETAVAFALGEQSDEKASAAAQTLPALTKRERQVAELVAKGMTNKAIAAQLVLSERTVGGHVNHILVKLGFTSRSQVAAWVVEQDRVNQRS
ncbi:putative ATPase/DNA-binding NarL/FixJ family response regulator [Nocardia sp. GAS34]|uniref:protein kinase domain-containing protein n=1 Tax=unclassified Nocardia TaxID=2637762 RepID=UPI003D20318B